MSDEQDLDPKDTQAVERAMVRTRDEVAQGMEEPTEVDISPDRTKETRTPGFTRVRMDWRAHDAPIMGSIAASIEGQMLKDFGDVYLILNEVYDIVREPAIDEKTGEIMTDHLGFTIWAREDSGRFIEDYSRLTYRHREDLLLAISTRMFEWEQRQADAWGEAMFTKAQWEERYANAFTSSKGKTVDDRANEAKYDAQDERYFSIYKSLYSRKIDSLVRSMERINQRLKDINY